VVIHTLIHSNLFLQYYSLWEIMRLPEGKLKTETDTDARLIAELYCTVQYVLTVLRSPCLDTHYCTVLHEDFDLENSPESNP